MDNINEVCENEVTAFGLIQEAQTDMVFHQHNSLLDETEKSNAEKDKMVKNVNDGVKNLIQMQQLIDSDEDRKNKQKQIEDDLAFKNKQLEEDIALRREELACKKEQIANDKKAREDDLNFRKEQAEEAKKNFKWDILIKILVVLIPVLITSIFTVIVAKITIEGNRKTAFGVMYINEVLERIGDISGVSAKDVQKECFRQAMNNKFK